MEDIEPISAVEQVPFCVELMKRLNIQRKQNYLCDITLVSKDNRELKAHRNVLSAASPFFCKLLQSDMKEKREGIVRFEDISGSVMEDVLEFIYTGTVKVTQENAEELIAAGNYLIIPSLKTASGWFLEREMSNLNCISTFYLAEKYDCDELITSSRRFIHENIVSVAKLDEFLHLEAKEIERWISSDEITVKEEADVFTIILDWVNHKESERKAAFEELFCHVRLGFLSRDCLHDIVTNELVRDSAVCLRLTVDATLKMVTFVNEDHLPHSPRKGLDARVLVTRGGKYTFCYIPEQDQWKRLPDSAMELNARTSKMIKFRDQLLTFTKYEGAERYDPIFNDWSAFKSHAESSNVAIVKGEIYAVQVNTTDQKTTVVKYNVELCRWEAVDLSIDKDCRLNTCVVAAGRHLYMIGGWKNTQEYFANGERFDTVEKKWEEIADMQVERGGAFGMATREKIYVAGGLCKGQRLNTCEMYSVSTNEWQFFQSLNFARYHGSMVQLNGNLYVLGGIRDSKQSELSVEYFDTAEDKWIQKTTIPVESISTTYYPFTGCAMRLSKGALDELCTLEHSSEQLSMIQFTSTYSRDTFPLTINND
ncbi:Kelch-like protein 2 [Stylophora pistillata]|uniref:Kelch-like protein 2 n=1 Tax=Stylophora pistillata TaxID=50429 RepID=A0A2B4RAL3_STYPI|nr:Kelch-like protein 2 [Stylophora pistillata]